MVKKFNLKFWISVLAIAFASAYLTSIVDAYTLNTWPKRIFVLCYFVVISILAAKSIAWFKLDKSKIASIIALVGAAVTIIFAQSAFLPAKNERSFFVQATKNENSEYGCVTISEIKLDGKTIELSKLKLESKGAWALEEEKLVFTPNESLSSDTLNDNILSFTLLGESLDIIFECDSPSDAAHLQEDTLSLGQVRIYGDSISEGSLSLSESEDGNSALTHSINFAKTYSIAERIILNVGAAVTMIFVYKALVELVLRFVIKKNTEKKTSI